MIANTFLCPVLDVLYSFPYCKVMKQISLIICTLIAFSLFPAVAQANKYRSTDFPLPRFVSLDAAKVYARTGPGKNYPIKWVYQRNHMPVEIIQEYEGWRKVKDVSGDEGWIHKSLLTGERTVLIQAKDLIAVYEGVNDKARVKARFEPGVVAQLDKCTGNWCKVETGGYRGWVERKFLWGIYEGEELN